MAKSNESKIIDLEDYDESINMLIYGDSGVGKTVLGGSAPNTLIVGIESGIISAKRQGSKAKLWPVETWDDVREAYNYLSNEEHSYKWVIVDSITDMQEKALRWILDRAVKENPSRDPDIPAIQDHQKWQNMFKRFVDMFNDLPVNVMYTALSMRRENEEGEDIILPLMLGKDYQISQSICGKMHVVGYMKVIRKGKGDEAETRRRIIFQSFPPYFAKDRYDALGRWVDNPTLPELEALITAGNSPAEPKRRATTTTKTRTRSTRKNESEPEPEPEIEDVNDADDDDDFEDMEDED